MPTRTIQMKKLQLISWLMLASEVLLVLFLGWWITGQYQEERMRLDKDIGTVFTTVENRISDSLLNKEVRAILQGNSAIDSSLAFELNMPDGQLPSRPSARKILYFSKDETISPPPPVGKEVIFARSFTTTDNITILQRPENTRKVLRIALQQIMNDIDIDTFRIKTDTALLRKEFLHAIHQDWPNTSVRWLTSKNPNRPFAYHPKNSPHSISLSDYQLYIIKAIVPQVAFCLILLLLSSLAFILAYRNTRQQTLFSQQKDHFISNISHELKTPVATTKVAIEALAMYDALEDPQRSQRYLRMAGWEINRLETMINKIMDITHADNDMLQLRKVCIQLSELVHEITHSLQQVFIEKKIHLEWDMPEQALFVLADHTHLTGAIYNLIDNAIKYGNDKIRISLRKRKDMLCLSIADNGPGVPQAYETRIFEKFVRVPQGDIHNVRGYGLGLSYAQYIIAAHKGTLILEKEAGWGAVFSILLPETNSDEV